MAVAGLSIDMGTGGSYAESATGFTNNTADKNFFLFLTRVANYGATNYAFGVYASANDYMLFNFAYSATPASYYPMYFEWKGGGTVRDIIMRADTVSTKQYYGNGQQAMCLSRSGNDLRLKMIDFGGDSETNDPALVTNGSATLVAGHDWTALKAGRVQIQRYNNSQQGHVGLGPIVMVEFSGAVTWTDADIEAALMDPSQIPDLVAARGGCTIVHQWDGLTRSLISIKPNPTTFRTALATNDVIVDSIGGVNLTYTKGSGTGYVYPDYTPVGQYGTGFSGRWHNINESVGPLCVADEAGGYYSTRQTTDGGSMGLRWLTHLDDSGAEDRIPIPIPGVMSRCTDGSGTLTMVTGDLLPAAAGLSALQSEYHHGIAITKQDINTVVLVPVSHSLTAVASASAAPIQNGLRYNQQAHFIAVATSALGDIDAMTPTLSTLTHTLAGSGNVTFDYQQIGATYALSCNVGSHAVTISRAAGGGNGYLVCRKVTAGVETCIKITNNDLSNSGAFPTSIVPLGSNAVALIFVLRNATGFDGNPTGVRCIICKDVTTFNIGSFTNLTGTALASPVLHSTMQTGPDTTGTDISGFGATPADSGNGYAVGTGDGTLISIWAHGVGNNASYVAANVRYKINVRSGWSAATGFSNSTTVDITDIIEANYPNFRSASGKGQWSVPRLRHLNADKTRFGIFLTDAGDSTMVEDGSSLGGCPFDDTFGTRLLALTLTTPTTSPLVTWYGEVYEVSGDILSVDIPSFSPDSEYTPFLMLQGYVSPASGGLGTCRNVPYLLSTLDDAAALIEIGSAAADPASQPAFTRSAGVVRE